MVRVPGIVQRATMLVVGAITACGGTAVTDLPPPTGDAGSDAPIACTDGQTRCGGACVDLASDPSRCGDCATTCAVRDHERPLCVAGACKSACDVGFFDCDLDPNDGCEVDATRDSKNCGFCGHVCPVVANERVECAQGTCATAGCAPGFSDCDHDPSDGCEAQTSADTYNCGACGHVCVQGQTCTSGTCGCMSGYAPCPSGCKDTANDALNCGGCGKACAIGQSCVQSACACPPGQRVCNGACTNTQVDRNNCGNCSIVCAVGQDCNAGVCQCPYPYTFCGGSCVDTRYDPGNCGMCAHACTALGQSCSNGTCACPDPQTVCNGRCVDESSDPANCGGCGVPCGGATPTCRGGACVGASVVLATGLTRPEQIAVDASYVYFTGGVNGAVSRVSIGGGAVTAISAAGSTHALAIDPSLAFYTDGNDPFAIFSVSLGGGAPSRMATSGQPQFVAVDASNVYWSVRDQALQMPKGGGAVTVLATTNSVGSIAVDATTVYFAALAPSQTGEIDAVPIGGGPMRVLVSNLAIGPRAIAVDATSVYFSVLYDGTVKKVPLGGGPVTTLATNQNAYALATDGARLYWVNQTPGTVMSVPVGGGTPALIASNQSYPLGVAVDAKNVYWTESGNGRVWAAPK